MKTKIFFSLMFLIVSMFLCVAHTAAEYEPYTQWGLPEGAKARLGKGSIENVMYSLDRTRLAIISSIGIGLYNAHTSEEIAFFRGSTHVFAVAFSPDSTTLAGGSENGDILLWDATSGTLKNTLEGHTDEIGSVAFSPDGTTLASTSTNLNGTDTAVRLWDVASGTNKAMLEGHTGVVQSIAFSPDGTTLAGGANILLNILSKIDSDLFTDLEDEDLVDVDVDAVWLWDVASGTLKNTLKGDMDLGWSFAFSIIFSPDGSTLAGSFDDGKVGLWDVTTGTLKNTFKGDTGIVWHLVFSPDGSTLAGSLDDGKVGLWDVTTGTSNATLEGHTNGVIKIVFSPDSSTLAIESWDNTVRLWDVTTGTLKAQREGHIIFSPDHTTYVGVSEDNSVQVWDEGVIEGYMSAVLSVVFSPDGTTLASGNWDGTVRLWDVTTGTLKATLEGHTDEVNIVVFSPDSTTLATASGSPSSVDTVVDLWDVATGTLKNTLEGHTSTVWSVVFSPNGTTLASASWDDTVRLWDVATGTLKNRLEHTRGVRSTVFSPDSMTLASGSDDGAVRLWDVTTGTLKNTLKGHEDVLIVPDVFSTNPVWSVDFSPDGTTLASGYENADILLWDVASGTLKNTLREHTYIVNNVIFSPDGTTLATESRDDTIRLWDVTSGTLKATLEGHTTGVFQSITFSPDGSTLASNRGGNPALSSEGDTVVRLWDVASGTLKNTLEGHTSVVQSIDFSPDGTTLASGSWDGTVLLWELPSTMVPVIQLQLTADVNKDGVVNIQDLVLVASRFGETGENEADVNGDGVVNIQDLVLVAGAFGEGAAAAPMAHNLSNLTPETVKQWLTAAEQMPFTDAISRRGIAVLEHLLATLTPKETALLANYPNPFNPETWIPYQLSKPTDVTLTIYAANGQVVRTLALGHQPAGMYQSRERAAYWDGRNQLGEPVASGVYFYTLTAGEFTATRKMLILK